MTLDSSLKSRTNQVLLALGFCAIALALWKFIPHPAVAVVIGLVPIAIIVTLRAPLIMVVFFVAFSFFRLHEAIEQLMPLKIPLLLSLGAFAGLGWGIFFTKSIKTWWTKEMTLLIVFFGLVVIGMIVSPSRAESMEFFKNVYWKIILMTFAIAWLIRKRNDFKLLTRVMLLSGAVIALKTHFNKINGIDLIEETRVTIGRELGSVLGDPNDLALVLMFPMAFAVAMVITPNASKLWRFLGIVIMVLLFSAVLATQSRGGLLGIMGVFGVFAYRRMKSKILFFTAGAIAAVVLYAAAGISGRSSGGAAEEGLDASAEGRLWAWEAAVGMALHRPITGVGVASFYYNYYAFSPHWDGKPHAVHSTWFGVLAETGIVGFAVFITFIISLGKKAYRTLLLTEKHLARCGPDIYISAQAAYAGLVGTAISATFLTHGFLWPFYILGALIMAGHHAVERIVQNTKNAGCSLDLRDANQTAKTL